MTDRALERRYGPTSGQGTGVLGLICCAVIVAVVVLDGLSPGSTRVGIAALALAVLVWAYQLRPRIILSGDEREVTLRNPWTVTRIPAASITTVAVKTFTSIGTADGEHHHSVAVGYTLRRVVRGTQPATDDGARPRAEEQRVMQEKVLAVAESARARRFESGPAIRRLAVVELTLLAVAVLAFAVTFLL